jgi:hypothetical protein
MPRSSIVPLLALWPAAYLGCAAFLLLGLLPSAPVSATLLGELSWLALIGSAPTLLVLAAVARASRAPLGVRVAVAVALAALTTGLAWGHTDFLLSGPRWTVHGDRQFLRAALAASLGLGGAAGWFWLLLGARIESRRKRLAWASISIFGVALVVLMISRYRAYDHSLAQLVFPGGLLCAACVELLGRSLAPSRALVALAVLAALPGLGSRTNAEWVATGEREVIAHSRAGGLAMLYVLPHDTVQRGRANDALRCAEPGQSLETAPVNIDAARRRNVIIITVDALRRDVVGAVEAGVDVTPALSTLATKSVWFDNATTTYPATLFAIGSAFTGLSPAELYLSPALPETIFTRSRGHVDEQIVVWPDVSWFRLPIVTELLTPGVEPELAATDAAATDALVRRLKAARRDEASVMAWVHYYSPHDPYIEQRGFPFGKGKRAAYLSEVAYFDAQLGELLDYLEEDGWTEDTLIVFFSDHGEAVGERRYYGHHVYLDGWMVDVPLALWHADLAPSQPPVGVSVADVAPTVLHFLGLPQPSDIEARSLLALDPNTANRATFSEAFPVRGRALFESFRLPALDDETIHERLRGIRVSSKGYEPKGAITRDAHRLVHHRGADTVFSYQRASSGEQTPLTGASGAEVGELLRTELDEWERRQLERIRCRLRVNANARPGAR